MRMLYLLMILLVQSTALAEEWHAAPSPDSSPRQRYQAMPDGQGGYTFWPSRQGLTGQEAIAFQSMLPQYVPSPPRPDLDTFAPSSLQDPLSYSHRPIEWPAPPDPLPYHSR